MITKSEINLVLYYGRFWTFFEQVRPWLLIIPVHKMKCFFEKT